MANKFSYTFTVELGDYKTQPLYVRVDKSPEMTIINGEAKWLPLKTVLHIPDNSPDDSPENVQLRDFFQLLSLYYGYGAENFGSAVNAEDLMRKSKLGNGFIEVRDGVGEIKQKWMLEGLWPESVNFGELCYSSSSEVDIEVSWRFLSAKMDAFSSFG